MDGLEGPCLELKGLTMVCAHVSPNTHVAGAQRYVQASVSVFRCFCAALPRSFSIPRPSSLGAGPIRSSNPSMRSHGLSLSRTHRGEAGLLFPVAAPFCWQVLPRRAVASRLPWDSLHLAPFFPGSVLSRGDSTFFSKHDLYHSNPLSQ